MGTDRRQRNQRWLFRGKIHDSRRSVAVSQKSAACPALQADNFKVPQGESHGLGACGRCAIGKSDAGGPVRRSMAAMAADELRVAAAGWRRTRRPHRRAAASANFRISFGLCLPPSTSGSCGTGYKTLAANGAICNSAHPHRPLRARDKRQAMKMNSWGVLWLLTLLTLRRTWRHLQGLEDKERN
jgi:hypothetical protein